jgi:hypothetical protein
MDGANIDSRRFCFLGRRKKRFNREVAEEEHREHGEFNGALYGEVVEAAPPSPDCGYGGLTR